MSTHKTMNNQQQKVLWHGAFRYYCGSSNSSVSIFCDSLIDVWPTLSIATRGIITNELEIEFRIDDEQRAKNTSGDMYYKRLGHDIDREQWERVRAIWR